jgi:hypothetical protein
MAITMMRSRSHGAARDGSGGTPVRKEARMLSGQGWSEAGSRTFAAEIAGRDGATIRMTVESMAGRRWEWIVWERGKAATTRHGTARTAQAAMRAAEEEAASLAEPADARAAADALSRAPA